MIAIFLLMKLLATIEALFLFLISENPFDFNTPDCRV
jgi:hypothetical protein